MKNKYEVVKNKIGDPICRIKEEAGGKKIVEVKSKYPARMEIHDFIKELKKFIA